MFGIWMGFNMVSLPLKLVSPVVEHWKLLKNSANGTCHFGMSTQERKRLLNWVDAPKLKKGSGQNPNHIKSSVLRTIFSLMIPITTKHHKTNPTSLCKGRWAFGTQSNMLFQLLRFRKLWSQTLEYEVISVKGLKLKGSFSFDIGRFGYTISYISIDIPIYPHISYPILSSIVLISPLYPST